MSRKREKVRYAIIFVNEYGREAEILIGDQKNAKEAKKLFNMMLTSLTELGYTEIHLEKETTVKEIIE